MDSKLEVGPWGVEVGRVGRVGRRGRVGLGGRVESNLLPTIVGWRVRMSECVSTWFLGVCSTSGSPCLHSNISSAKSMMHCSVSAEIGGRTIGNEMDHPTKHYVRNYSRVPISKAPPHMQLYPSKIPDLVDSLIMCEFLRL